MDRIDVEYCFYDDDYRGDADPDSRILQGWHVRLWSKPLPNHEILNWVPDSKTTCLSSASSQGELWVSSDTIATTHSSYQPMRALWADFSPEEQRRYEHAFYRIGGFTVFPVRRNSLNQARGWRRSISDRFDLTIECIRRHYMEDGTSPLSDVLQVDAPFFRMFGGGPEGFGAYVNFFHLQDLVHDGTIKWFDEFPGDAWDFDQPPLPQNAQTYRRYLDNVEAFVSARNRRIDD